MRNFRKEPEPPYTEGYKVKYLVTTPSGFSKQLDDVYYFASKNRHAEAAAQCIHEHGLRKQDILGVKYQ